MHIQCIETTGSNLSPIQKEMGYNERTQFPIVVGKHYLVFGMTLWANHIWYLVVGENQRFPEWMPDALFIITDSKVSRYWHYCKNKSELVYPIQGTWGYEKLINDVHADKLADKDLDALAIFDWYREYMELEFADPDNPLHARSLDSQKWIMCSLCSEAWEEFSLDGMIRCPNCRSILHNPFYVIQDKISH
ncbi:MAG: hypothetical protein R3E79_55355 [Caldilineaceae bacterium]